MTPDLTTTETLQPYLKELIQMEPLFHAAAAKATPEVFEELVADDFWEIGASGQRYSRDFALKVLKERERIPSEDEWDASDHHLSKIAPETFLLTYALRQPARKTLRSTIWQYRQGIWKALFHQGTTVQDIAIDYKMLKPEK